jgi:leucyl-tRNA synthetase
MEITNWASDEWMAMSAVQRDQVGETLILLFAPFAPHLAEELWARLGHAYSVHDRAWPAYRPEALFRSEITLVVQVDGKVRARVPAPSGLTQSAALELALSQPAIRKQLPHGEPTKVVYVPDRLINLVVV